MAGGSKSKNKGSTFERDLCKTLSEALGGTFIRSANSGAFLGGKNAGRKAGLSEAQIGGCKGDLVPPSHLPRLVVEAKFYADFRFHQLLAPEPMPQLEEWIAQATEAVDPGDIWLIVFKINRRGTYVFVPGPADVNFVHTSYVVYGSGTTAGVVTTLESFLAHNTDRLLALAR